MAYLVYESGALTGRRNLDHFPTFEAAEAYVRAMPLIAYERDEDHAGCADALTTGGQVICIAAIGK